MSAFKRLLVRLERAELRSTAVFEVGPLWSYGLFFEYPILAKSMIQIISLGATGALCQNPCIWKVFTNFIFPVLGVIIPEVRGELQRCCQSGRCGIGGNLRNFMGTGGSGCFKKIFCQSNCIIARVK